MSKISQNNPFEQIFKALKAQILAAAKEMAVGTVSSVSSSGIGITIDGDSSGVKKYTCSRSERFSSGDRVLCARESGTWVVICKIGAPGGPEEKTAAMTQAVGIDGNGRLWTEPTQGGGGEAYTLPVASTSQLGGVKTSAAYVTNTYTVKIAADANGVLYAEKPSGNVYATELATSSSSDLYNVKLTTGYQLIPSHNNSITRFALGTSANPWGDAYIGYYGTVMIGNNAATQAKIGFFGHAANAKQTLSLSSQNMGYTSVTASNYLIALNNLIGILREKHGLIG